MQSPTEVANQNQAITNQQTNDLFNFIHRDAHGRINNAVAVKLITEYKRIEGHDDDLPQPQRTGKSKCVWFSIDDLEEVCRKVRSTAGGDGVRIYFGRYTKDSEFSQVLTRQGIEDHRGKRTIVLFTTIAIDGTTSQDDMNENELKEALGENIDPSILAVYNHGELCPNNCTGTLKV